MISAKLLLHSINPRGVELTTWVLTYWRAIHAEFMTHRAFSRNAASSRAIPVHKQLEAVMSDCSGPVYWGENQRGMQAETELDETRQTEAKKQWRFAALDAVHHAGLLSGCGAHKQVANRVIEPFTNITVLMTTTVPALRHFFALRAHPDAQPEFQVLAYRMLNKYVHSTPGLVDWGQWHVPFGDETQGLLTVDRLHVATARCARVSYLTHDGKSDTHADLALYERLSKSDPAHASAFEHCARAHEGPHSRSNFDVGFPGMSSGWFQYRKQLANEFNSEVPLRDILARKPEWVTLDESLDAVCPLT
jgi:hypothetical protein